MDEATRLIASGYRCISNRGRIVSRIDRPDWREHMARSHTKGFPGSAEKNLREGMQWVDLLGHGAGDQYRRVYSRDQLIVSEGVYKAIKNAGDGAGWGGLNEYRELIPETENA